jgi:hypothetical protein
MSSDEVKTEVKSEPATGLWGAMKRRILLADSTVTLLKNLSILGLAGTVLGSYFQYTSWREEKNITRYKEDYAVARGTFDEVVNSIGAITSIQQSLFFAYAATLDRLERKADNDPNDELAKRGADLYKDYTTTRNSFRKSFYLLATQVEINIDWSTDWYFQASKEVYHSVDPTTANSLGEYNFDCDKYLPGGVSPSQLGQVKLLPDGRQGPPLIVDWRSAKHQAIALYYCSLTIDALIRPALQWASGSSIESNGRDIFIGRRDFIRARFDRQIERLDAFIRLSTWRIEELRKRSETRGFLCHLSGLLCS